MFRRGAATLEFNPPVRILLVVVVTHFLSSEPEIDFILLTVGPDSGLFALDVDNVVGIFRVRPFTPRKEQLELGPNFPSPVRFHCFPDMQMVSLDPVAKSSNKQVIDSPNLDVLSVVSHD